MILRARIQKLNAIIRLLMVLIRVFGIRLVDTRLAEGAAKARLLQAIERSKASLSLKGALKLLGLCLLAIIVGVITIGSSAVWMT